MKSLLISLILSVIYLSDGMAQKPAWADNPGTYAYENFVAIGIAKDKKVDKAREKAEKKARKGIESLLSKKYGEKDVKKAMASLKFDSYWLDPATKYSYCLALLPIEAIDKNYAAQKNLLKAKASALDAVKMLNEMNKDPDIIIIRVEEDESMDSETESTVKTDEALDDVALEKDTKKEIKKSESKGGAWVFEAKNKKLGDFKWFDQDVNSKYEFLGNNLVVTAATGELFIPEEGNKKSPRIELSDIKGDFVIEAKVSCNWEKYYNSGFGLAAHSGTNNVRTYIYYNGTYVYMKGSHDDVELPTTEKSIDAVKGYVYLKLAKKDFTFRSYYSTIENEWIEIGEFETKFADTFSLGVFFMNDDNSSVQFKIESIRVTQ